MRLCEVLILLASHRGALAIANALSGQLYTTLSLQMKKITPITQKQHRRRNKQHCYYIFVIFTPHDDINNDYQLPHSTHATLLKAD